MFLFFFYKQVSAPWSGPDMLKLSTNPGLIYAYYMLINLFFSHVNMLFCHTFPYIKPSKLHLPTAWSKYGVLLLCTVTHSSKNLII